MHTTEYLKVKTWLLRLKHDIICFCFISIYLIGKKRETEKERESEREHLDNIYWFAPQMPTLKWGLH